MGILKDNWFLTPDFDFEYKSYQVLGYAQYLNFHFENMRFYPYLEVLKSRIQEVLLYKQAQSELEEKLHRDIDFLDFENKKIVKLPVEDQTGILDEIQNTLAFAEIELQKCYDTGCSAFENAKREIQINPVGIIETNPTTGILLFRQPGQLRVYTYSLRMVVRPDGIEKYKDLKTNYIKDVTIGILPDLHEIKWNMIKSVSMDVGTNAYLIDSHPQIPHFETVLPVVKYYLLQHSF